MNIVERFLTKSPSKKMLRFVCIIGLILSALISIPLLIVSIVHARGNPLQETNIIRTNPFVESLNEFDYVFAQNRTSPEVGRLDAILNRAEEHAAGVDAHLSVLKRRRILAKAVPEYRLQYRNAVSRVLEQFPYSENISIVAGDAVLLHKEELDQQDQNDLLHYAKNISVRQNTKNPLILLGFYVFEGSARNLLTARQIPQAAEIFTSAIDYVGKAEQPNLVTASAILQILAGNQNAAINLINKYKTTLLEQSRSAWFMVEALYDFDDPSAAASILGIEDYPFVNSQSIIRLSDALYRMNNINDARFFWNLLLVPENETESVPHPEGTVPSTMLEKSLYNLAITCASDDEKRSYLEELLKISPDHIPGIILYSRLLNYDEAISMLQKTIGKNKNDLIELELIRQNRRYSEPGKTAADTWLLLGRYPADANLYQWASYYFEEMQMFDEAYQLEKNAGYNAINGHWLVLQKALDAIRRGNLDEAETLLKNISMESSMKSGWEIPANLGLIKESQLSFTEALEYYETASSLCGNNKDQALIQLNIARCHRAMGNPEEAIRVLQYAQELDPDNLHVRLEMRKLQNPQL